MTEQRSSKVLGCDRVLGQKYVKRSVELEHLVWVQLHMHIISVYMAICVYVTYIYAVCIFTLQRQ